MGREKFPFLIGTTSYIIQGDLVDNARYLSKYVRDIELVLFETPSFSNIPTTDEIELLKVIQDQTEMGFTVHFPIDKKAGSVDLEERIVFANKAEQIIDMIRPLSPRAWILHLEGIDSNATSNEIDRWKIYTKNIVKVLSEKVYSSDTIAIENLGYPWYWHLDTAAQAGTSLCCDIGHLCLYFKNDWARHFEAMLPHTSVIHLHGVSGEKDHISLKYHDRDQLVYFFEMIKKTCYRGVITLEIFSKEELFESMDIIDEIWRCL